MGPCPVAEGQALHFTFSGRLLVGRAGDTIASALMANGIRSWRQTRFGGRPRGIYCGIGACFDCLVDVGEEVAVRACLRPLGDGDRVRPSASVGPAGLAGQVGL
jgi:hypothetical protein